MRPEFLRTTTTQIPSPCPAHHSERPSCSYRGQKKNIRIACLPLAELQKTLSVNPTFPRTQRQLPEQRKHKPLTSLFSGADPPGGTPLDFFSTNPPKGLIGLELYPHQTALRPADHPPAIPSQTHGFPRVRKNSEALRNARDR